MRAEPYLYFDGRCEEAVEFYRHTIGAEVVAMVRFKDGGAPAPAGAENKLMHVHLRIGESTVLASDGQCRGAPSFQGFSLSLSETRKPSGCSLRFPTAGACSWR